MKQQKSILLVGGGTGGHLVPVYYLYKNLKKYSDIRIKVLGSGSDFEKMFFNDNPDYKIITTGKINRTFTLKNISELIKTFYGLFQVLFTFISNKPKIVFSKGGFVSFPVIFWAKLLKIPYFIHESDIEMGLSNKYAAKGALKVFVGFPVDNYKGNNNLEYSGQIIKDTKSNKKNNFFDFLEKKTTIFITGGSQGSLNINKNVVKIVANLLKSYNIIHQTGQNDFEWVKEYRDKLNENLKYNYYITDMLGREETDMVLEAIEISDLVISRAGANTIAEIAINKKAMILIPYKHAAGNHQNKNAEFMFSNKGALIIKDDELSPDMLREKINEALANKENLGINAYQMLKKDGLKTITNEIIHQINSKD